MAKLTWMVTILAILAVVIVVATLSRYQSLDPCDWLINDVAAAYHVTPNMAEAKIRAGFLLDGVIQPDATDCLTEWWSFRGEQVGGSE